MKILNMGSCNIDYVYSLDHIVAPGETETSHALNLYPGGKGLNQSIALARAGARVYHAGFVGNDGQMLLDVLKESGVDVSFMDTVDCKNGHAVIQVSAKGENSIFLYEGSNGCITTEYVDRVLRNFGEGDIILLQNEINNVSYIIEQAYRKGMCIVFNPSPYNEKIREIECNMLTYLILNEVEAECFSGSADPAESLRFFQKQYPNLKVMLTLGKNGCVYQDVSGAYHQPIYPVKAVDTTAAGDTFTGYFVAGIAKGIPYPEILKISSAAAALSVSKSGAAPSIPKRSEVIATFFM